MHPQAANQQLQGADFKLGPAMRKHVRQGFVRRQRFGNIRRIAQVVVVIDERNNPGPGRHFFQLQAPGVAAAIGEFVVLGEHGQRLGRQADLSANGHTQLDMGGPEVALRLAGLGGGPFHDAIGNVVQANVMQQGAHAHFARDVRAKAHFLGHHHGQNGDVQAMEIDVLTARFLAHHMQRGFRAFQKGRHHLADQKTHLLQRLFRAREDVLVHVLDDRGGLGKSFLDPVHVVPSQLHHLLALALQQLCLVLPDFGFAALPLSRLSGRWRRREGAGCRVAAQWVVFVAR